MVSVKLKFRASTVAGREGSLYYRLIYRRSVGYVTTRYKIYPTEWSDVEEKPILPPIGHSRFDYLSTILQKIQEDTERFEVIIRDCERSGRPFTVDDVVTAFRDHSRIFTLFAYMEKQITLLQHHGQYRTAETYRSTLNSFRLFRQEADIPLDKLTPQLLSDYLFFLKKRGIVPNTIVFYLKRLRAIYNKAVDEELVENRYPFRKISMATEKTVKRAIPLKYIRKLKDLELPHSTARSLARDMFLFSFYTRGMSFVDIAYLKKENLRNGILSYRRKKTGQLLTMHWEPCMAEIAVRYGAGASSPYILSILNEENGDIRKQYNNALSLINRKLKEIGREIGLPYPLTMYTARHSWASIARNEGIPLSVISEGMGHESEKTTRIYLAALETQVIDRANRKVLAKLQHSR